MSWEKCPYSMSTGAGIGCAGLCTDEGVDGASAAATSVLSGTESGELAHADNRPERSRGNSNEPPGNAAGFIWKGNILVISGVKYSYIRQNISMPASY